MKKVLLLIIVSLFSYFNKSNAQVSLVTPNVAYTQTFDALANTGTSSTLPTGWALSEAGTGANATYTAGTGSGNSGDTYSFGAAASTERALGTLRSGSVQPTIGAVFTNSTGKIIKDLVISYKGEQWRIGATGRVDRLDFQYSTTATAVGTGTFTAATSLNFTAPVTTGTVGALDGNLAANRTTVSATIAGVNIAVGATFVIRWLDIDATGSDDGLGIDDFSLTPVSCDISNVMVSTPACTGANATFNVSYTVVNQTGTFNVVDGNGNTVGSGISSPIACTITNSTPSTTTTVKVVAAADPTCQSLTSNITYPNCAVCSISASASPVVCSGTSATFNVTFNAVNGSGNYQIKDITNNVVLATSATSPVTVTIPNATSSTFQFQVIDAGNVTCTSSAATINVPTCNVFSGTATPSIVGLSQGQFNILVKDLTGVPVGSTISVGGQTMTYNGTSPVTFGPFTFNTSATPIYVVTITSPTSTLVGTLSTTQAYNPGNGIAQNAAFCNCAVATNGIPGGIMAQSAPNTFQTGNYTQLYALVTGGNVVSVNNTGFFTGLNNGTYQVYAINIENGSLVAMNALLTTGSPISGITTPVSGLCYSQTSSSYTVNCISNFITTPQIVSVCSTTPGGNTAVVNLAFYEAATGVTGGTWSSASTTPTVTTAEIFTYTATDNNNCTKTATLTVNVNTTPVAPTVPNITVCSGGSTTITPAIIVSAPTAKSGTAVGTFNFNGLAGSNTGTSTNPVMSLGAVTRSNSIASSYAAGCGTPASATEFALTSTTWSGVPNSIDYYEVPVSALGSNILKINSISLSARRSNTGPLSLDVFIDGLKYGTTQTVGTACTALSYSGSAFIFANKTAKIQLRPFGATGFTGTLRIDDLVISSDVFPATTNNVLYNYYGANPTPGPAALIASNTGTYTPTVAVGTTKTFYVTQYNGVCESPATAVTVTVNAAPTATFTQVDPSCPTGATGSINVTATGLAPLTYAWTGTGVTQNVANQTGLAPGTFTFTVTDGNTPACTTSGTVTLVGGSDANAPTLNGVPASVTVECDALPAAATVTATDDCTTPISAILSTTTTKTTNTGACTDNSYTIVNTWTATDGSGNSTTGTQTITVQDIKKPAFVTASIPANVTLTCPLVIPTAVPTATDNCDNSVSVVATAVSNGSVNPALCAYYNFTITRTFIATDNCGNTTSAQQVITVQDIAKPTLTLLSGVTKKLTTSSITLVSADVIQASADNCSTLTTVISPNTFDCSKIGMNVVTVTVTDVCGNSTSATTTITILDGPGCNATFTISDPCVCKNNATTLQNGQFGETVTAIGFPNQIFRTKTVTGLYKSTAPINPVAADLIAVPTTLTVQTGNTSKYDLIGLHIDSIGYSVTVERIDALGAVIPGSDLTIADKCYYPTPILTSPGECVNLANINYPLTAADKNNGVGTATFKVDGVTATTYNPVTLGTGNHTVEITFDAGTAASNDLTDPGCIQTVYKIVKVVNPTLSCTDLVNVSLPSTCDATIDASSLLTGGALSCSGGYLVTIMYNGAIVPQPLNASNIGKTYIYKVTNGVANSCWGNLKIEDKLEPQFVCTNKTVTCDADIKISLIEKIATSEQILGAAKAPKVTECSDYVLTYSDMEEDLACPANPNVAYVTKRVMRTWKAIDAFNNTYTCVETIEFERPSLAGFTVQIANKNLNCDAVYAKDAKGNPSPSATGFPSFSNGTTTIASNLVCDLMVTYSDTVLTTCGTGQKVLRGWVIVDWCNNKTYTKRQTIIIEDTTKPTFTVTPKAVTLSVGNKNCALDNSILDFPTATDNCSSSLIKTFKVKNNNNITVYNGNTNTSQITLTALTSGIYTIEYTVTDECGNATSTVQSLTVNDQIPPVAVCRTNTKVSLTADGSAMLEAKSIDEGSNDNCCFDANRFEIKRLSESDNLFTPKMMLNCLDTNVMIVLRVWDCNNLSNTCMVNLKVDDKLPPVIFAKDTMMVCSNPAEAEAWLNANAPKALSLNNYPTKANPGYFDNCKNVVLTKSDLPNINNCGTGTYTRTWTATDGAGFKSTASQTVTTINMSAYEVKFPDDVILTCSGNTPNTTVTATGEPTVTYKDKSCPLVGIEKTDQVFDLVPGTCYKILRTWKILNWCQISSPTAVNSLNPDTGAKCGAALTYSNIDPQTVAISKLTDVNDPLYKYKTRALAILAATCNGYDDDGYMEYTQVIKIIDNTPPAFTSNPKISVEPKGKDCAVTVTATPPTATDCTNKVTLSVTIYKKGLGGSETLIDNYTYSNTTPKTWDFDIKTQGGSYVARFKANDNCGNFASNDVLFEVKDIKKPTPVCANGLSAELMATGMVMIPAVLFNNGSYDNCTESKNLKFKLQVPAPAANATFDPNIAQDNWTFTCPPKGTVIDPKNPNAQTFSVGLWVGDEAGNWDFCSTFINIQDNMDICGYTGIQMKPVYGTVANDKGEPIQNAKITLSGMKGSTITTGVDGKFEFKDMPVGETYTMSIEKNEKPLNGVTTYDLVQISKHILNVQPFNTPYKWIAADINQSKTVTTFDMVELRKLILMINADFPNNKSWRFVDANYVFPTGNPLATPYTETITFTMPNQDKEMNFVGVKIGDLNGNATPNSNIPASDREGKSTFNFDANEQDFISGQSVLVNLESGKLNQLDGGQFTFTYDAQVFDLEAVMASKDNYSVLENGKILFSWSTKVERDLLSVRLRAKQNGLLSNSININSSVLKAEVYTTENEYQKLGLLFNGSVKAAAQFELFQNVPNPTNTSTTIGFTLPNDEVAKLILSDATGRVLKVIEAKYSKGYNQISVSKSDIGTNGVIYYRLETTTNVGVKKMIFID